MKRTLKPAESPLYSNCAAYPPDEDVVLFRCDAGRMDFYLRKGLAELIQKDPPIIRLKFRPKGRGHVGDPYFTQALKNLCVVCGSTKDLSRHHIVPWIYRKWCFPRSRERKERNWSYDVLALCVDCHGRYEKFASELKREIHREFDVPLDGGKNRIHNDEREVLKACFALRRYSDRIPPKRRHALEETVRRHLGKTGDLSLEDLFHAGRKIDEKYESIAPVRLIARHIGDVDDFAIRWRRHFVKTMKPRFLPPFWDPERRIYSEPDPNP